RHEALASYDRALALDPNHRDARHNRAILLTMTENYRAAETDLRHVIALRPNDTTALEHLGIALAAQQRHDEALANYDTAAALALNRRDEALASYNQAIRLRTDYADALIARGVLLLLLQRDHDALADFDHVLAQRDDPDAWKGRANALVHLHRYEDAVAGYSE